MTWSTLKNKVTSLNLRTEMEKQKLKKESSNTAAKNGLCIDGQCIDVLQNNKRHISGLILQMQKDHGDLEQCTAKLQSSMWAIPRKIKNTTKKSEL